MSTEEFSIKPIYQGATLPPKPKVYFWHKIHYYLYNFARKPLVFYEQKRLISIFNHVKQQLEKDLLPKLFNRLSICEDCRNSYMALKPQIFLSQIKAILSRMYCPEHAQDYKDFLNTHEGSFNRSEEISAWINGFKK